MGSLRLFSVAGIPVHFTAWYAIILLFWMQGGLRSGLIWGGVITVSILVHELGHGLVARHYRLAPWIEIHGWGGLTHHDRAPSAGSDAKILIAGPGAGLILGGICLALSWAMGAQLRTSPVLAMVMHSMVYVNLVWSLINLVPLWPLDGGQLFRLGLMRIFKPARAEQITHVIGAGIGLFAVFVAHSVVDSTFLTIIAGLITWQNVTRLGSSSASGAIYTPDPELKPLLSAARAALEEKNWAEASRLAYRLKEDHELSAGQLSQAFEILGVAAVGLGRHEEAISYLSRLSAVRGRAYFAWVECVLRLKRGAEAAAAVAHPEFERLPQAAQADLLALSTSGKPD